MNSLRTLAVCLALVFTSRLAIAAEYNWPGHGTVSVDAPATWSVTTEADSRQGFVIEAEPRRGGQGLLKIVVAELPQGQTLTRAAVLNQVRTLQRSKGIRGTASETAPVAFAMTQGFGWHAQMSDAANAKIGGSRRFNFAHFGLAALIPSVTATITMQYDESESDTTAEMVGIVESVRVEGETSDVLQVERTDDVYELTAPQSRLKLKIPGSGLNPKRANAGGATASRRYFNFVGMNTGWTVSGWFEDASRYSDLLSFWKSESDGLKRGRQGEPTHVRYGKVGDWDVVEYDMPAKDGANSHIRAELTHAGTWIDLHASITEDRPAAELHADLRVFLESLVVETK